VQVGLQSLQVEAAFQDRSVNGLALTWKLTWKVQWKVQWLVGHSRASLPFKAGARLVSQPPTPWAEPQPVMDGNLHSPIPVPDTRRIAANVAKLAGLVRKPS